MGEDTFKFVMVMLIAAAVAAAELRGASNILAKYEEIKALIASNDEAFDAGVKAAREAVAALAPTWAVKFYVNRPSNGEWIGCNGAHEQVDVLAAIDALTTRGKEGR